MESVSSPTAPLQLSLCDQAQALNLVFCPPGPLSQVSFFPSCAVHSAQWTLGQIKDALNKYYFPGNPFIHGADIRERTFKNPETLDEVVLQDWLEEDFDSCSSLLLRVWRVSFDSDPSLTGIFASMAFTVMDGFTCFRFHQSLANTLRTGIDHFQHEKVIEGLQLHPDRVIEFVGPQVAAVALGPAVNDAAKLAGCLRPIYHFAEHARLTTVGVHEVIKADEFALKNARTVAQLVNASLLDAQQSYTWATFGNYLIYPSIPISEFDPNTAGEKLKERVSELKKDLLSVRSMADMGRLCGVMGAGLGGGFVMNNYANCERIKSPTLEQYRWQMPLQFGPLLSGAMLAITLTPGRAQTGFLRMQKLA